MKNEKSIMKTLQKRLGEIDTVRKAGRLSALHIKWRTDTFTLIEDVFGRNSAIFTSFASLTFSFRGTFLAAPWEFEEETERKHHDAFLQDLEIARGILSSGVDLIKRKGLDGVYEGKDTPEESSEIVKILSLVDSKLRKTIRKPPKNEGEVQDALENLFIGGSLDGEFTRDKESIVYSSKTYYPDFVFGRIKTVVETKLCNVPKREKQIIAEINDDILAYSTKYANLVFVVYDVGTIKDIDQFKNGIESKNVLVRVVKH